MYYASKATPDGQLYCVKFDKVDHGDHLPCATCEYFRGSIQGLGRECEVGQDDQVIEITDPYEYLSSRQIAPDLSEG